jgi:hypothetical protein
MPPTSRPEPGSSTEELHSGSGTKPSRPSLVNESTHVRRSRHEETAVVVASGALKDVVPDLEVAVLHALAEDPRGVVCDLDAVQDCAEAAVRDLVVCAGEQGRDWPAVPVALVSSDLILRRMLAHQPLHEHVLVHASVGDALAEIESTPAPVSARLPMPAHSSTSWLARKFVRRTCLGWGLVRGISAASLVVSELVTNAVVHAGTDLELIVSHRSGLLRLAVRDHTRDDPLVRDLDAQRANGRGMVIVGGFSRAWGSLPTADGGKVVWAVLDA